MFRFFAVFCGMLATSSFVIAAFAFYAVITDQVPGHCLWVFLAFGGGGAIVLILAVELWQEQSRYNQRRGRSANCVCEEED